MVDINGVQASPSLPLTCVLDQTLRDKAAVESESEALKFKLKTLENKYEVLSNENDFLSEKVNTLDKSIATLQAKNENLEKKLECKQKEFIKPEESNKIMKKTISVFEKSQFEVLGSMCP